MLNFIALIEHVCVCRSAAEFAAADQQSVPAAADTTVQLASQQLEPQPGLFSWSCDSLDPSVSDC